MPPRKALPAWRNEELPIYDVTGRHPRLVLDARRVEVEPSPLLEAIRAYLERGNR